MKNIYLGEDELVILFCYAEKNRERTLANLENALEKARQESLPDVEMIRVIEELCKNVHVLTEEEFQQLILRFSPNWDKEDVIL